MVETEPVFSILSDCLKNISEAKAVGAQSAAKQYQRGELWVGSLSQAHQPNSKATYDSQTVNQNALFEDNKTSTSVEVANINKKPFIQQDQQREETDLDSYFQKSCGDGNQVNDSVVQENTCGPVGSANETSSRPRTTDALKSSRSESETNSEFETNTEGAAEEPKVSFRMDSVEKPFSTYLMTPQEIATKAAKEFARSVDEWEHNHDGLNPSPERFASYLTDRFLCRLLDPLKKSVMVSTVRRAIVSEIDRISKLSPRQGKTQGSNRPETVKSPEPHQHAATSTSSISNSRPAHQSNLPSAQSRRHKQQLRGPAARTRARGLREAGRSLFRAVPDVEATGTQPTVTSREEVSGMRKRFFELKFSKNGSKGWRDSRPESTENTGSSKAEFPSIPSENGAGKAVGFEELIRRVQNQHSEISAIKQRAQGTKEMRIIAQQQKEITDQW